MSTTDSSVSWVGPVILDKCIELDIALDSAHSIVYGLQSSVSCVRTVCLNLSRVSQSYRLAFDTSHQSNGRVSPGHSSWKPSHSVYHYTNHT
jgi:hypothetical protein